MRNSGVFLGKEALGSWVRELRASLDLGFLDFLFVLFGQNGSVYHVRGHQIISIATVSF